MTTVDYARAARALSRRDPVLADLVRRHGACGLATRQHPDPFQALVRAIVSQQLSTKAAATIASRFVALFGGTFPTPRQVDKAADAELRAVGLSFQKISYLRDLCRRIQEGSLPLAHLADLGDEEVIAALIEVKGIGRWTAEMFLIFNLLRPDVFPLDDLGLQAAIRRHYFRGRKASLARLRRLGEGWAPWRSVATWYLWRSLDPVPVEY